MGTHQALIILHELAELALELGQVTHHCGHSEVQVVALVHVGRAHAMQLEEADRARAQLGREPQARVDRAHLVMHTRSEQQ
jgi:hypothetical protein